MAIHNKLIVGGLVTATSLSAFILTSTTANAETYTRSARIEVASACTLSGAVATAHTANVSIGTYRSDIGETVLSAVCNDAGGFGIYAIGYTGDTDGNNKLVNSTDSTVFINTGLAESGNTSAWAMKLTAVENAATPTILNDYDDYNVVPNDYVKVASYPSTTTASASSMFKSYYAAYISLTQPAGIYNGQVKYVMVHPANGPAPEKPSDTPPYISDDTDMTKPTNHPCAKIGDLECEDTDDDGVEDSLVFPANSLLRTYEIAYTNAKKPMYVEDPTVTSPVPGWRPMTDADLPTIGGKEVRFAMQDIGMTLDGTANGTKVCDAAYNTANLSGPVDEALVMDLRDGKSYFITKFADGKCWMTQNLDLDLDSNVALTSELTDLNTKSSWTPRTSTLTMSADGTVNGWEDSWEYPYSFNPGEKYIISSGNNNADIVVDTLASCKQNNITGTGDECRHLGIGNKYNYIAALAEDSITIDYDEEAAYHNYANSICPKGWRLPHTDNSAGDGRDYTPILMEYSVVTGTFSYPGTGFGDGGFNKIRISPFYIVRTGHIVEEYNRETATYRYYLTDVGVWTHYAQDHERYGYVGEMRISDYGPSYDDGFTTGGDVSDDYSVRCIAR